MPLPKLKPLKPKVASPQQKARKEQRLAERKIEKYKARKQFTQEAIDRNQNKIEAIDTALGKTDKKILTDDQFDLLAHGITEDIEIIFKPNPGPQTLFFEAAEREVLYGGTAGGGKSFGLLIDVVRDADNPAHRGIIFRRYIDELRDLIAKTKEVYPAMYPGCKWNKQESTWTFPSGATVWYTYLENEDDVTRYQGQAFNYIGFDELTQWPTPYCWNYMRSRLRTTSSGLQLFMRATANPGGVGGHWVKKMFIDPAPWGEAFWATDVETGKVLTWPEKHIDGRPHERSGQPLFKRRFIPAKLSDNPYLAQDGEYEKNLLSLPENERRRLLYGEWDIVDGAAFPEFNRSLHVVQPFRLPSSWPKFRACDYGYGSPSCVLWFAVDGEGRLFVYRELYGKGMDVPTLAQRIKDIELIEGENLYGVLDASMWGDRGNTGPTPAEVMNMQPYSLRWRPSDRGKNSRMNGKLELHRRLKPGPSTMITLDTGESCELPGRPMIQIFNTCTNLIRTLPMLPLDKNNPEDVDTDTEDHAYDAARYGCMSRPMKPDFGFSSFFPAKVMSIRPNPADPTFGY